MQQEGREVARQSCTRGVGGQQRRISNVLKLKRRIIQLDGVHLEIDVDEDIVVLQVAGNLWTQASHRFTVRRRQTVLPTTHKLSHCRWDSCRYVGTRLLSRNSLQGVGKSHGVQPPKAPIGERRRGRVGEVWGGSIPPQPTRRSGEHRASGVRGTTPAANTFLAYFTQNPSGREKCDFLPSVKRKIEHHFVTHRE